MMHILACCRVVLCGRYMDIAKWCVEIKRWDSRDGNDVWTTEECDVPNIAGTTRDAMMLALKYTLV